MSQPKNEDEVLQLLGSKRCRASYNYCGICGRVPRDNAEPNYAPLRWWDPDDGWKIGTLCSWCAKEAMPQRPKPEDIAFDSTNGVCDKDPETDEDPIQCMEDAL